MSSPNTETESLPAVLAGGDMGAIVGSPEAGGNATVGFFGSTGTTRVAASTIATLADLKTYLVALGLLS